MIPLSVGDSIRVFFFLATDEGSILLLDLQSQIGRALFMYKNSGVDTVYTHLQCMDTKARMLHPLHPVLSYILAHI